MRLSDGKQRLPWASVRGGAAGRRLAPLPGVAGYTLLELLVALAVIGLLSIAAVATFQSPSPSVLLRATADQLVSDLKLARSAASRDREPVVFRFAIDDHHWQWASTSRGEWPEDVSLSLRTAAQQEIIFYPDRSSSGGYVTLSLGDSEIAILVDWLSGRVRVVD